jgi:hypothetical protein
LVAGAAEEREESSGDTECISVGNVSERWLRSWVLKGTRRGDEFAA